MNSTVAACIYLVFTIPPVILQIALALGAPLGHLAMGGKFPGVFPPVLRVGAVIQGGLLLLMTGIVLIRAGMILGDWISIARYAIWVVVGIAAISAILNLITPSKWERILWGPTGVILFGSSLLVAAM